jgi:type II secretory pathway component GspD/PulD (secretin)
MKQFNHSSLRHTCIAPQNFTDVPGRNLHLNFHNTPLGSVLDFMSDTAGFMIEVKSNVTLHDRVDFWSNEPLDDDHALDLLGLILHKRGCTVIKNGRKLSIMRTQDAKKSYIPLHLPAKDSQIILNQAVSARPGFVSSAPPSLKSN